GRQRRGGPGDRKVGGGRADQGQGSVDQVYARAPGSGRQVTPGPAPGGGRGGGVLVQWAEGSGPRACGPAARTLCVSRGTAMDKQLMRAYVAELIGTFALVFVGAGAVLVNAVATEANQQPGLVGIALAHGLILAVVLSVTLHVSGGFHNPAVTLMLWVFN